jgi:nitrogen fixation NifU-like protein
MSDLRELYQELIIDHSKRPRNFRVLEEANRKLEGYNPLCGDKITVFLELENDRVNNVSFQGSGCAISTASASVMTESVKGKTLAEAEALFEVFHNLVTGKPPAMGKTPIGEARGVLRCVRVPSARQMRGARLAYIACGVTRQRGDDIDGVIYDRSRGKVLSVWNEVLFLHLSLQR